ncbi:MAG: hypothetical protein ABJF88_06960 [Rhodothermales bacterium]
MSVARALVLLVFALGFAACGGSSEATEENPFGRRADDGEGRETLLITPPDEAEEFFLYPAIFETVEVRSGVMDAGRRPVELLIRGALPDGCTALHNIEQRRVGNLIDVTFEMRRPKGAVCTQVVRPYRFYYTLAEPLPPGDYTLTVNGSVKPFTVFPLREGEIGG